MADALEQPLLLPRDMEAYRRFSQPELFLSLKRDLAMVSNSFTVSLTYLTLLNSEPILFRLQITQQVFVAEEFCRDSRSRAEAEAQSRTEIETTLGSLKHDHLGLTEKFKESEKRRKSAEAGLKSAETQAEDQRKELYSTQLNLATEKQAVVDLKTALQRVESELWRAREEAQLIREAAEAKKNAAR